MGRRHYPYLAPTLAVNAVTDAPNDSRRCRSCDAEVAIGDRFCRQCGSLTGNGRAGSAELHQPTESFHRPTPRSTSRSALAQERFAPGQLIAGRFRIVTALGKGGMGEVYRADDLTLGQSVALKFLPAALARDADRLQRLRGEVKNARQVAHPNVCRVYDLAEADGQLFLSMEYVDGHDLGALLKQINRLPEERGVEIARQLCLGLGAIHDRGLLHRDLKPGNVMLDGRGQVRITDFGLAAPAEAIGPAEIRDGTPAYQAPEQLAGREVTVRSDIYALGLILYELFTGKRPFAAADQIELARRQAEDAPSKPSSHVSGFNTTIEQIILKCLEKEPRDRPRTAYEVLAALPGGDPLQAALAAGQTPSPEMVANAKTEGSLHPLVALALLIGTLALLALVIGLKPQVGLFQQVPQDLSPRDLAARARELIRQFGYTEAPRDSAFGLENQPRVLKLLRERDKSARRWDVLATGQPPAMFFWYRQSPTWMQAIGRDAPGLVTHHGQISASNPPLTAPGMIRLCLDLKGRLIEFQAELQDGTAEAAPPLDWPRLLQQAGLKDMRETTELPPGFEPPVFVETRLAWRGFYSECPDVPVLAQAGLRGGRLVFFHAAPDHPLERPLQLYALEERRSMSSGAAAIIAVINVAAWTIGAALAWHNLRRGRANVRGTMLLAGSYLAAFMLAWLFSAHHIPEFWKEQQLLVASLGEGLYSALVVSVVYLGMEPFVRRRWPWRVVAWNRLLAGRWRDPLVGRDVLVGIAGGALAVLCFYLSALLPGWLGRSPEEPALNFSPALSAGPTYVLTTIFVASVLPTLAGFFLIFLLYLITRREWLAALASVLIILIPTAAAPVEHRDVFVASAAAYWIGLVFLYLRFGLLSVAALSVTTAIVTFGPTTFHFTAWYGGDSLVYLGVLLALVLYGFVTASGGQWLAWVRHVTGEAGQEESAS